MIIVKLQGGMGNQMFQYAFARKIQQEKKIKLFWIYLILNMINKENMH